jgi:hypothetical protein
MFSVQKLDTPRNGHGWPWMERTVHRSFPRRKPEPQIDSMASKITASKECNRRRTLLSTAAHAENTDRVNKLKRFLLSFAGVADRIPETRNGTEGPRLIP